MLYNMFFIHPLVQGFSLYLLSIDEVPTVIHWQYEGLGIEPPAEYTEVIATLLPYVIIIPYCIAYKHVSIRFGRSCCCTRLRGHRLPRCRTERWRVSTPPATLSPLLMKTSVTHRFFSLPCLPLCLGCDAVVSAIELFFPNQAQRRKFYLE